METEALDGVLVVRPRGRIDMASAPSLRRRLAGLANSGRPRLVIDLAGVAFVDSSGLGALIGGLKAARQAGGDLRLANCGDQVREVLRITTLDRVLRPYDSVEAAVAGL